MNPSLDGSMDQSRLFIGLVLEKAQLAFLFLGRIRPPGEKETKIDLDAARLQIDILEMLQQKTRGNLTKEEEELLNDTLTELRLAYVEAVERQKQQSSTQAQPSTTVSSSSAASSDTSSSTSQSASPSKEEESDSGRRRFFKSYGP